MAKDPAFLFQYKDYLVSTTGWDADVRGWYVNLLCHQADKPDGLPTDLEELAELAGVKHSHFIRFSECWKRTLEAKFVKNDKGLLENSKLKEVLKDRRFYKNKQQKRGIVGAFIKKSRPEYNFSNDQWAEVSRMMVDAISDIPDAPTIGECLKRTLIAYAISIKGNAIANAIANTNEDIVKEKRGVGKKTIESRNEEFCAEVFDCAQNLDEALPEQEIRKFILHWTETNPNGKKMRFEMERTWNTNLRLLKWQSNSKSWNKAKKDINENRNELEELSKAAGEFLIARGMDQ